MYISLRTRKKLLTVFIGQRRIIFIHRDVFVIWLICVIHGDSVFGYILLLQYNYINLPFDWAFTNDVKLYLIYLVISTYKKQATLVAT